MPRKKNSDDHPCLTNICRETARILGCRTRDLISLMREALKNSSISIHSDFTIERFFNDQGEGALLKEAGRKGTMLFIQRTEFRRVLENGDKIPREMMRVFKFRWTGGFQKVLAFKEI